MKCTLSSSEKVAHINKMFIFSHVATVFKGDLLCFSMFEHEKGPKSSKHKVILPFLVSSVLKLEVMVRSYL